jgi:hypothetical protein
MLVWQCTTISHRYLRLLTGGSRHFLALLSKLGVVSCPFSQECVETVSIVPELVFIVCYFIRQRVGIEKGGGLGTHKTGLTPPWSSACIKSGYPDSQSFSLFVVRRSMFFLFNVWKVMVITCCVVCHCGPFLLSSQDFF